MWTSSTTTTLLPTLPSSTPPTSHISSTHTTTTTTSSYCYAPQCHFHHPSSTQKLPISATSLKLSSSHWISNSHALHQASRLQHLLPKSLKESKGAVVARSTPLGLEVVENKQPNSRVVLNIVVPPTVCRESYDEVLTEFSKKAKVPGFRPGKKLPESVLVNYVGEKQVKASAIEAVLRKTLPEAMASVAGRALKDTEHIVTEFDDLQATFSPSCSLRYAVAVDVAPDIGWVTNGAYKNLSVEVDFDDDDAVVQRAADAEIRSRLKELGSLRVIIDRGLKIGDVAILDVAAKRVTQDETEGDRILSAEQKGFQLDSDEGSKFVPGFIDALLGLEKGQSRTFDLTFPSTWEQESLRGVRARFAVDCKELFRRVLPDFDDSIASKLHDNCSSLQEVKEMYYKKHRILAEKAKNDATRAAVLEQLTKVVVVDVPNSLLEEQGRQMYAMNLIKLQTNMRLNKEQLVALSSQDMVHNFLLSKKAEITDAVKQSLAVAEIFKLEKLQYTEDELNMEVQNATVEFQTYNQEFDEERVREQAAELLEGSKVLDWLVKHSDIKYVKRNEYNSMG